MVPADGRDRCHRLGRIVGGLARRRVEVAAPDRDPHQLRPHRPHGCGHPRLQPGAGGIPPELLPVGLAHLVLGGDHRARLDPGPLDPAHLLRGGAGLFGDRRVHRRQPVLRLLPHPGALLGKNAADFTNLPAVKAIRTEVRRTGKLPDHGETIALTIPGTVSKFQTGQAYVYLPPAWFKNPEPQLPMIELIAGVPGSPSDWTRAGYADSNSTVFADQHHGVAPIVVIPDNNGVNTVDTECSNSVFGNAETYLVTDVPTFMQTNFNAAIGKHALAVAGLSAGGTCASILALRNPKTFSIFASYSGYSSPTYINDTAPQTIAQLYHGSRDAYEAHNPEHLLGTTKFPGMSGWFTAGQQDPQAQASAQQLSDLARKAGMTQVCLSTPPGGHDFVFWAAAFKQSLPWLSWKLGLTPAPKHVPSHCTPPVP